MLAIRNCVDVHNSALICIQESTNWAQDEAAATDDAPGRGSMLVFPGTSGSRHIWFPGTSGQPLQVTTSESKR